MTAEHFDLNGGSEPRGKCLIPQDLASRGSIGPLRSGTSGVVGHKDASFFTCPSLCIYSREGVSLSRVELRRILLRP